MTIKNPTQFLIQATQLPAAIEAKLPNGAPKLSVTLTDIANKLPKLPDFPTELPDLPAIPELPGGPAGLRGLGRRFVTKVEVTPVVPPVAPPAAPSPALKTGARLVFE